MKKFVMFSLAFVVLGTVFTGCSKKDAYDPERPEQDARELYRKNFLAYVGGNINSQVDWGFGSSASTRADEAPTVTLDPAGYSTEFSDKFFENVRGFFPEGSQCTSKDWWNYEFLENGPFFNVRLIYSNTSANDEIGLYYYDPVKESYDKHTKVVLYDNIQANNGDLGYYIQFNRYEQYGEWWEVLTTDGYSIWTNSSPAKRIQTRTYTIYMNERYHFGFYVKNKDTGKTYYTNQYLNESETAYSGAAVGDVPYDNIQQSYVFGLTDNDTPDCNILFAIIKAGDQGKYPLLIRPEKYRRIIAEDLNAHDIDADGNSTETDFDFNDIVLDAALTPTGAKCRLMAAGATLKIRINGDDKLEVHDLFKVDQKVMVNTHAEKINPNQAADRDPVEFEITGNFKDLNDIKLEVYKDLKGVWQWVELTAPKGDASCKIVVDTNFEWPDERQSLKGKYPNFLNYVHNNVGVDSWWRNQNNP